MKDLAAPSPVLPPRLTHNVPPTDATTHNMVGAAKMRVPNFDAAPVVHDDEQVAGTFTADLRDAAQPGGLQRSSWLDQIVDACVPFDVSRDGVLSNPKPEIVSPNAG